MASERNHRAVSWPIFASVVCAALLTAEGPAWIAKPPSQWTEQDAQQLLNASPWTHNIGAVVTRRLTEDQLREGGEMGQSHGVGHDGVDPKGSGYPVSPDMLNVFTGRGGDDRSLRSRAQPLTLRLAWESALPVRLAELKAHVVEPPTLDGDGYQIAVYGIPGPMFKEDPKKLGDPLKNTAALKREGKKDVKPVRVEVFQRQDGLVVVYLFPLSAEISMKDGQVQFEALIGRISVAHTYNLKDMQFLGKLEL
jgi:hypothetical protein